MSFRTDDYEPQGGRKLPEGLVYWCSALIVGCFFGCFPLWVYQQVAGKPHVWAVVAALGAGCALGAWVVKPWRR